MYKKIFKERRTERIEVRIEPTLKELLGDLAFEEKESISEYVRTLILEKIDRKKGKWK